MAIHDELAWLAKWARESGVRRVVMSGDSVAEIEFFAPVADFVEQPVESPEQAEKRLAEKRLRLMYGGSGVFPGGAR